MAELPNSTYFTYNSTDYVDASGLIQDDIYADTKIDISYQGSIGLVGNSAEVQFDTYYTYEELDKNTSDEGIKPSDNFKTCNIDINFQWPDWKFPFDLNLTPDTPNYTLFNQMNEFSNEISKINEALKTAINGLNCCGIAEGYNENLIPFFRYLASNDKAKNCSEDEPVDNPDGKCGADKIGSPTLLMTIADGAAAIIKVYYVMKPIECLLKPIPGNPWLPSDWDWLNTIRQYIIKFNYYLEFIVSGKLTKPLVQKTKDMRKVIESCVLQGQWTPDDKEENTNNIKIIKGRELDLVRSKQIKSLQDKIKKEVTVKKNLEKELSKSTSMKDSMFNTLKNIITTSGVQTGIELNKLKEDIKDQINSTLMIYIGKEIGHDPDGLDKYVRSNVFTESSQTIFTQDHINDIITELNSKIFGELESNNNLKDSMTASSSHDNNYLMTFAPFQQVSVNINNEVIDKLKSDSTYNVKNQLTKKFWDNVKASYTTYNDYLLNYINGFLSNLYKEESDNITVQTKTDNDSPLTIYFNFSKELKKKISDRNRPNVNYSFEEGTVRFSNNSLLKDFINIDLTQKKFDKNDPYFYKEITALESKHYKGGDFYDNDVLITSFINYKKLINTTDSKINKLNSQISIQTTKINKLKKELKSFDFSSGASGSNGTSIQPTSGVASATYFIQQHQSESFCGCVLDGFDINIWLPEYKEIRFPKEFNDLYMKESASVTYQDIINAGDNSFNNPAIFIDSNTVASNISELNQEKIVFDEYTLESINDWMKANNNDIFKKLFTKPIMFDPDKVNVKKFNRDNDQSNIFGLFVTEDYFDYLENLPYVNLNLAGGDDLEAYPLDMFTNVDSGGFDTLISNQEANSNRIVSYLDFRPTENTSLNEMELLLKDSGVKNAIDSKQLSSKEDLSNKDIAEYYKGIDNLLNDDVFDQGNLLASDVEIFEKFKEKAGKIVSGDKDIEILGVKAKTINSQKYDSFFSTYIPYNFNGDRDDDYCGYQVTDSVTSAGEITFKYDDNFKKITVTYSGIESDIAKCKTVQDCINYYYQYRRKIIQAQSTIYLTENFIKGQKKLIKEKLYNDFRGRYVQTKVKFYPKIPCGCDMLCTLIKRIVQYLINLVSELIAKIIQMVLNYLMSTWLFKLIKALLSKLKCIMTILNFDKAMNDINKFKDAFNKSLLNRIKVMSENPLCFAENLDNHNENDADPNIPPLPCTVEYCPGNEDDSSTNDLTEKDLSKNSDEIVDDIGDYPSQDLTDDSVATPSPEGMYKNDKDSKDGSHGGGKPFSLTLNEKDIPIETYPNGFINTPVPIIHQVCPELEDDSDNLPNINYDNLEKYYDYILETFGIDLREEDNE